MKVSKVFFKIKTLFALIILCGNYTSAQQSPCSAVTVTPGTDGTCTLSSTITAPNPTSTWSNSGNSNSTSGLVNSCLTGIPAGNGNLWFTFTVPATGDLDVQIGFSDDGGGNIDAVEYQLYEYVSGDCATNNLTLNYITCVNGDGAGEAEGTHTANPGSTYYVRMFDDNADDDINSEKYKRCFGFVARNNDCANATAVTPGGAPINESTLGSSLSDPPFGGGGWCPEGTVWYTFTTPPSPGCYSFYMEQENSGCNYVTIYRGGCPGSGGSLVNNNVSVNVFNDQGADEFGGMVGSTPYYVAVSNTAAGGDFTLNIQDNVPNAANDQCSGAAQIGTVPVAEDNAVAGCEYTYDVTDDMGISPANVGAGSLENVSWFTFDAVADGAVTITFANILCNNGGGGFQTGLFTSGGDCSTLTATGVTASGASGSVTYSIPAATAGDVYYIAMDGNAGSNCHFDVSGVNITPLPVELAGFNAKFVDGTVELAWMTLSENNNAFFTVEKSMDGEIWENVGDVDGAGYSSTPISYRLTDENPYSGQSYYRLRQTDYSGKIEEFNVVTINNYASFGGVTVYPNPVENGSTLEFTSSIRGTQVIRIMDLFGRIVYQEEIIAIKGYNMVSLPSEFLSKGMYHIYLGNDMNSSVIKLIKK